MTGVTGIEFDYSVAEVESKALLVCHIREDKLRIHDQVAEPQAGEGLDVVVALLDKPPPLGVVIDERRLSLNRDRTESVLRVLTTDERRREVERAEQRQAVLHRSWYPMHTLRPDETT